MAHAASNTSTAAAAWSSVVSWIGGIVATVVAALIVYHMTNKPTPVSNPDFYGVVADAATYTAIPNAIVQLGEGSDAISQPTDASGQYNIYVESNGSGAVTATVKISANGYKPYTRTLTLQPGSDFAEIALQRATAFAPGDEPPQHPHAGITFKPQPENFVKTQSVKRLQIKH